MERQPIGKKVRFEVFKRDGFVCQYCGGHPPNVVLHLDHIIPVAKGGTNDEANLITSCQACNAGKGAVLLSARGEPLQAEVLQEREDQMAGYAAVMEERLQRQESEVWRVLLVLDPGCDREAVDYKMKDSVLNFINKLGLYPSIDAAQSARIRLPDEGLEGRLKYFYGICHHKLRQAREQPRS